MTSLGLAKGLIADQAKGAHKTPARYDGNDDCSRQGNTVALAMPLWALAEFTGYTSVPDFGGKHGTEPVPPEPHRLVADVDASLVR